MDLIKIILKLLLIFSILVIIFASLMLNILINKTNSYYSESANIKNGVEKRKFPYPFDSALAICSDIDATDSLHEFLSIQEFLNTKNFTEYGTGVNLEIGNSFFPVTDKGKFAFFSNNPHDQEVLIKFIKDGYVDFIHSFNTAKNRNEYISIYNKLKENGCKIEVWANHAKVPSDVGSSRWCLGDNLSTAYYHTDITMKPKDGIKFVWTGEVSGILGQTVPISLRTFFLAFDQKNPFKSIYNNVFKELIKFLLSPFMKKYAYRLDNDLIYPVVLDDGSKVYGFVRNNTSFRGIRKGSTIVGLGDILTKKNLKTLIDNKGAIIIYTHFGQNNGPPYIDKKISKALRVLAEEYQSGKIYVTTTSKLLKYYANTKHLDWRVIRKNNHFEIHIDKIVDPIRGEFVPDPSELQGLSFNTQYVNDTKLFINEREILNAVRYKKPTTDDGVIMIPINTLIDTSSVFREFKEKRYF